VSGTPQLRVLEGGASNSRPTAKSGRAGLDTLRFRWRDKSAADRAAGLVHERGVYHDGRGVRRTEDGVTLGAVGGMLYLEGRAAAILDGPENHELVPPSELVEVARVAAERAGVAGSVAAIGRLDLASEAVFDRGADGRRFLAALATLDVPWLKTGTEGGKGAGLETVYWRTVNGRSVKLRAYDKGVESGTAAAGERIRLERQARFPKARERVAHELVDEAARLYVGRELRTLVELAPGRHDVGDVPAAVDTLRARVERGQLRPQAAERLIGYLALHGEGLPARTARRREAELRSLGIAVSFAAHADRVPVRPILAELVEAFAA